jgi:hypothetical protein
MAEFRDDEQGRRRVYVPGRRSACAASRRKKLQVWGRRFYLRGDGNVGKQKARA